MLGNGDFWPKTTTTDIIKQVKNLVALKREVVCYKTEVFNWLLSYKIRNTVVRLDAILWKHFVHFMAYSRRKKCCTRKYQTTPVYFKNQTEMIYCISNVVIKTT